MRPSNPVGLLVAIEKFLEAGNNLIAAIKASGVDLEGPSIYRGIITGIGFANSFIRQLKAELEQTDGR